MSNTIIKNFGIIVEALDASQSNCDLIINLNKLVSASYQYCPVLFYQTLIKPVISPLFCQLQQQYAWGFDGPLIATNLTTMNILLNCVKSSKKLFYVYDLEWLYMSPILYTQLANLYQHTDVKLIARSSTHFDILKKCWQEPIGIIENYDYKEFRKLIDSLY